MQIGPLAESEHSRFIDKRKSWIPFALSLSPGLMSIDIGAEDLLAYSLALTS